MDTKKTNLTPELKEIYDRVMNTSAGTPQSITPKATSEPLLPTAPPAPTQPAVSTNLPQQPTITSVAPLAGTPLGQQAAPVMPPPTPAPEMPSMPVTAEEALTNTPARPLTGGNTFSYNGSPSPTIMNAPQAKAAKGKFKMSLPILIAVGVVFIVVWGVFWAIILGFIK